VIEALEPLVDGGRFAAKAVAGEPLSVRADVFAHGDDLVRAFVRHRRAGTRRWTVAPMAPIGNDRFEAAVVLPEPGHHQIEVLGEVDALAMWRRDATRRAAAGGFDPNDPVIGSRLLAEADELVDGRLGTLADELGRVDGTGPLAAVLAALDELDEVIASRPPATTATPASSELPVLAERPLAAFSSWYECFPRSASSVAGQHGTLADLAKRLDYVAELGFDVLYLPPIHPIGTTARKGRGNSPVAGPDDVGSPWAIGSRAGGHTAVAPELGTLADFDELVDEAASCGIEIALDIAFQCSPDHPWVRKHPEWFAHRPDGTIACAENPPKRYEDIYPLDFTTSDREGLYAALLDVVLFWVRRGVRVFRVDNPHTKPFDLWEWLIASVRKVDPGVVFLSEAFTRPKVMHRLAKLGFDQSYTYFAWRDHKDEIVAYFEELAHGPGRTYFRPNVWPNTPDILAKSLQHGGRASFVARLVLAACLSANYGIYGPVFELLVDEPAAPGSEEYADSEKYEIRQLDVGDPRSIRDVVRRVNAARRAHPALQRDGSLRFHRVDNDRLVCWSKRDERTGDAVLCVVNLDPEWPQSGFVELDLGALGLDWDAAYEVRDELDDAAYTWTGPRNFVLLDPARSNAHVLALAPAARSPEPSATFPPSGRGR